MICTKCKKTVRVISKFLDDQLTDALEAAHLITNEVAKVIGNPLFQLLISQLPAGVNTNAVLTTIENVLSTSQKIATCEHLTGLDRINCLMNALNILPKEERNGILARLKSALTANLDGNRYEPFVYDTAGQLDYFKVKIEAGAPVKKDSEFIEIVKDQATEQNLQNTTGKAPDLLNVVQIAETVLKAQEQPTHAMPIQVGIIPEPATPRAF